MSDVLDNRHICQYIVSSFDTLRSNVLVIFPTKAARNHIVLTINHSSLHLISMYYSVYNLTKVIGISTHFKTQAAIFILELFFFFYLKRVTIICHILIGVEANLNLCTNREIGPKYSRRMENK